MAPGAASTGPSLDTAATRTDRAPPRVVSILVPTPLGHLVRRMLAEWRASRSIFDLPERSFYQGHDDVDLAVRFHGETAATPLGPAAGPHTQLAQNVVLSYL